MDESTLQIVASQKGLPRWKPEGAQGLLLIWVNMLPEKLQADPRKRKYQGISFIAWADAVRFRLLPVGIGTVDGPRGKPAFVAVYDAGLAVEILHEMVEQMKREPRHVWPTTI